MLPTPARGGAEATRLVVIGENPGRTEEKLGAPFVGMAGKVLDSALKKAGIERRQCHLTNATLCRGDSDKENDKAAECCAPRLLREVSLLPKNAPVVTMGKLPTRTVLGVRSILIVRGFIWRAKEIPAASIKAAQRAAAKGAGLKGTGLLTLKAETLAGRAELVGRTVLPTLAPAFILRADTWLPVFLLDMVRAGRAMRGGLGEREDVGVHATGGLRELRALGGEVSLDIETDGIVPRVCRILCVGLTDIATGKTVVIWPWKDNYAERLTRWLRKRERIVFHNGAQFDLLVMRAHGVDLVTESA